MGSLIVSPLAHTEAGFRARVSIGAIAGVAGGVVFGMLMAMIAESLSTRIDEL